MAPRSKNDTRIADKIDRLQIDMAEHKAKDEAMYQQLEDVKSAVGQNNLHLQSIAERLGEYNQQLAVHIAGVQESKRHNDLLEASLKAFVDESKKRLDKLEVPHKWAVLTYHALKMFSYATGAIAAIYGIVKFFKG